MFTYFYLSPLQKNILFLVTILFVLLFLIIRPIIFNYPLYSRDIIVFGLIFYVIYGLTMIFTNTLTYEYLFKKILNQI